MGEGYEPGRWVDVGRLTDDTMRQVSESLARLLRGEGAGEVMVTDEAVRMRTLLEEIQRDEAVRMRTLLEEIQRDEPVQRRPRSVRRPPRPFMRREVPLGQCACPTGSMACFNAATGEDRLCDDCRDHHRPDDILTDDEE